MFFPLIMFNILYIEVNKGLPLVRSLLIPSEKIMLIYMVFCVYLRNQISFTVNNLCFAQMLCYQILTLDFQQLVIKTKINKNLKVHSFLNLELEVRGISVLVSPNRHAVCLPRVKAQITYKNSYFSTSCPKFQPNKRAISSWSTGNLRITQRFH